MNTMTQNTPGVLTHNYHRKSRPCSPWRALRLAASSLNVMLATFLAVACGPSPDEYNIPPEAFSAPTKSTLSVGDVVRITYTGAPEYNQAQKIQPDGRISLPTVGNVTASGRSVSSLQASLTLMYKPHLNDPTVVVSVQQPAAAIYVGGEVNNPGKVPLDRSMTVLEAVMESGGFSKLANPKQVVVIRNIGGKQQRYLLNLSDPLAGYESQAFYVRAYDVIYVKRSNW